MAEVSTSGCYTANYVSIGMHVLIGNLVSAKSYPVLVSLAQ